jgi:DNA protecting protein DprA
MPLSNNPRTLGSLFKEISIREVRRTDLENPIPPPLWEMEDPPKILYLQGSPSALDLLTSLPESGLAIVGTRNPQPRSVFLVRNWVKNLAEFPLIILSGLASGIDTVAHHSALEAGLKTIAFLGAGHHLDYPKENTHLRNQILRSGGLLISEYPPHTPALKHHFLKRNRIIATWSKATWVVEAGFRSGALNTARWARDHHRLCFAVPGFPGDPALSGNQTLIDRDHAIPTWGIHSFGAAWLNLATLKSSKPTLNLPSPSVSNWAVPDLALSNDEIALYSQISTLTFQNRGSALQTLLEIFQAEYWDSPRFFQTLQSLSRKGHIVEKFGNWVVQERKNQS